MAIGSQVHDRIERGFGSWARFVVRFRWSVIGGVLLLTGLLGSSLPDLAIENSAESLLRPGDPQRVRYDEFRERFGAGDSILIAIHPPDVFSFAFLDKLRAFHRDLERELPYVEEITSLVNARNTRGEQERLVVEGLLDQWPRTPEDLEALRQRVLANPLYVGTLVSEDGAYTTLQIVPYTYSTRVSAGDELGGFDGVQGEAGVPAPEYLSDAEGRELVEALRSVLARYQSADFAVSVVGGPVDDVHFTEALQRDIAVFAGLTLLVTVLLLYAVFRRPTAVLLPVGVVLLSLLATLGIMVRLGIPLSAATEILPAFLLVVGLCDSVHILSIFHQQLATGAPRGDAIVYTLEHSGLAVVLTSLTTAGGLISFAVAELAPVSQLGIVAPLGVLLAMAYSLSLLPALLVVVPAASGERPGATALERELARLAVWAGDIAAAHPRAVLAGTLGVLLLGLGGVLRVHFAHDGMRWLPEGDPLRAATELMDREFQGVFGLEVLVDTGQRNGLYDPNVLARLERGMRRAESLSVGDARVGKVSSLVDIVEEIHQALNENRPEYHVLPRDRALIAQELLLFENAGSDDLEDVADTELRVARISVFTPWVDALVYTRFVARLERELREVLGPELPFEMTGGPVLFARINQAAILSYAWSYAIALLVIAPIMILLIGNLRRGLVAMIPNLIPVYLVLALMGWLDMPLDASNLLVGAIVIGLAVDDTIHFMHKFNRYLAETGDARLAVHRTLATTGAAIIFTSLVLALGFSVFLFAYMRNAMQFGLLCSFAATVALLADLILAPALMVLMEERAARRAGVAAASRVRA